MTMFVCSPSPTCFIEIDIRIIHIFIQLKTRIVVVRLRLRGLLRLLVQNMLSDLLPHLITYICLETRAVNGWSHGGFGTGKVSVNSISSHLDYVTI